MHAYLCESTKTFENEVHSTHLKIIKALTEHLFLLFSVQLLVILMRVMVGESVAQSKSI